MPLFENGKDEEEENLLNSHGSENNLEKTTLNIHNGNIAKVSSSSFRFVFLSKCIGNKL